MDLITNVHDFRVFMKAGARCGRLDNTCHHFDYRLRDTLHALSEKLGYSGSDNVLPDHRPSDQSKSVICKPGVAYGIDTISEDTNHLQRSMPAPSSCPFPAEVRDKDRLATFDTPVFNLKPRLNGPGAMALEVLVDHSLQHPFQQVQAPPKAPAIPRASAT
jgi:hypothetical protein